MLPLIASSPAVAEEVLLAACIEEPQEVEYGISPWRLEHFGLAYWQNGFPAIYWKTPFLAFFQKSPEQAIDGVLRLVNYATDRWLEVAGGNAKAQQRERFGVSLDFSEGSKLWYGNYHMFALYRHGGMHGEVVTCALMALEKWLHDELEAGRDVKKWLELICSRSSSLGACPRIQRAR